MALGDDGNAENLEYWQLLKAGMAAIVVDKNLPSEQTFALLPEHAATVGFELIQTTEQLGSIPSKPATKRKPSHP